MKRIGKWLAATVLVLVLLLAAVAVALQQWVGSADFRGRVAQQLSAALGVRVELGRVSVDVWPLPAVALEQVQVKSQPPLSLERVEARPSWLPLLQGRREIATLLVRNAVVPQQALAAIAAAFDKGQRGARHDGSADSGGLGPGLLPRRVVLDHVTWVYAMGGSSTVDVQVRLDPDGLPGSVKVEARQGRFQGARASLTRGDGQWLMQADIGGGTVKGPIQVQPGARGISVITAQLAASNVELSALTERSRTLTGRLEGQSTLRAEIGGPGAFVDSLQSRPPATWRWRPTTV